MGIKFQHKQQLVMVNADISVAASTDEDPRETVIASNITWVKPENVSKVTRDINLEEDE